MPTTALASADSAGSQAPLIRSGYSATATIVLDAAPSVLTVPESAIEFSGDSTFVYVVRDPQAKQPTYDRRPVQTGLSDGIYIEIRSGLSTSDRVRGNLLLDSDS